MMERLRESRWVYILISVLLAVVFWLYIRDTEDPTMSRPIYNVPVQIANERVLEERGLTVSGLSQSSLTVEVTGPVSVLNNLTRSNITASVDVSSITETGGARAELPPDPAQQCGHHRGLLPGAVQPGDGDGGHLGDGNHERGGPPGGQRG